jgi:hypothetical protein
MPIRSTAKLYLLPTVLLSSLSLLIGAPSLAHEGYGSRTSQSTSAAEAVKPPEFKPGTPGVCRLYNLSGYLALNPAGRVIPLQQYCQQQHNWVWYANSKFWQAFRQNAASETITYAQTLDQARVEAYAQSICSFLNDGGTLQELAQQGDQKLPADFDQAVIKSAVETYCPQYRSASR